MAQSRAVLRHGGGADAAHPRRLRPGATIGAKRGGRATRVELDDALGAAEARDVDVLALNIALEQLERLDPRQGRLVVLRFFGGLTIEEVAEVLDISPATAKREWVMARMWLRRELASLDGLDDLLERRRHIAAHMPQRQRRVMQDLRRRHQHDPAWNGFVPARHSYNSRWRVSGSPSSYCRCSAR